jgi:hypothetical protein
MRACGPRAHAFSYGMFYLRLPLRSMGRRIFPPV